MTCGTGPLFELFVDEIERDPGAMERPGTSASRASRRSAGSDRSLASQVREVDMLKQRKAEFEQVGFVLSCVPVHTHSVGTSVSERLSERAHEQSTLPMSMIPIPRLCQCRPK